MVDDNKSSTISQLQWGCYYQATVLPQPVASDATLQYLNCTPGTGALQESDQAPEIYLRTASQGGLHCHSVLW